MVMYKNDNDVLVRIKAIAALIVALIMILLPCIYCRNSFREANFGKLKNKLGTNISLSMLKRDGMKKYIYCMHNFVNRKLRGQEIEAAVSKSELKRVKAKWKKKTIDWETAKTERFAKHTIGSREFWTSFFEFSGYILCDWRDEVGSALMSFFGVFGELLHLFASAPKMSVETRKARVLMSRMWNEQLRKMASIYGEEMQKCKTSDHRFEMMYLLFKSVMPPPSSLDDYKQTCQKSIVGCSL